MDLMHANCVRAGYLDLDGCTVVDMLPRYADSTKHNLLRHSLNGSVSSSPPALSALPHIQRQVSSLSELNQPWQSVESATSE